MKTDIHTHILPGIDDGSRNVEMSMEMLRRERKQGIEAVVLTPHFYRGQEKPGRFLERRENAWRALERELKILPEKASVPALYMGAEVAWAPDMLDWEEIRQLCFGGGKYMLLEMPFTPWSDHTIHLIYDLMRRRGIIPVIAHLERYLNIQKPAYIQDVLSMGVPVQVSAAPLLGMLKRRPVLNMLRTGQAQVVASDCHNLDTRQPNLEQAVQVLEKKLGWNRTEELFRQSELLLDGAACLFSGR